MLLIIVKSQNAYVNRVYVDTALVIQLRHDFLGQTIATSYVAQMHHDGIRCNSYNFFGSCHVSAQPSANSPSALAKNFIFGGKIQNF